MGVRGGDERVEDAKIPPGPPPSTGPAMQIRHLSVILWIACFLLVVELPLEVRAVRRGWEALLLGKDVGWATSGDARFGPSEDFPFRSLIVAAPGAPAPEAESARDAFRVWTASSSYGADLQLEPELVFPNLLGTLLSERGRETVTLNCSFDGSTIVQNTTDLRAFGPTWRPHAVVLYQMSNDIDQLSQRGAVEGATSPGAAGAAETASESPGAGSGANGNVLQRLVEQTTVYKHLKSIVTARLTKGRVLRDALGPDEVAAFEARLNRFIATARELGAQPVLCTFATSHVRSNLAQLPEEYELNLLRFNLELSIAGWLDGVERCNAVLEHVAREQGVPLVDLAGPLAGRSELFRDFWHLRAEGHAIAARALAAELIEVFEE